MAYLAKWMRRCLFICLFAVFLMSDNASAMNLSTAGTYGIQCNRSHVQFNANYNTQSMYNVGNACEVVVGSDLVNYRFTGFDIYLNSAIPAHSIFNVSGQISGASINGSFNGFSGGSAFSIYQQNITALDGNGLYFSITGITGDTALQNFNFSTGADYVGFFGSGGRFAVQPVSFVVTSGGSDYSNSINGITNILNDLRTQNNDIWNMLNNLNNNTDNVNNHLSEVKDAIKNQNEEEKQETQDASDDAAAEVGEVADNAATSNLIGIISNFISAISDFTGGDCNLSLAFPSYAGGTLNVNVCQNKDKAGNIIEVFTSLTLIVFYLPLALKLLSMIYNEIRSFTNG